MAGVRDYMDEAAGRGETPVFTNIPSRSGFQVEQTPYGEESTSFDTGGSFSVVGSNAGSTRQRPDGKATIDYADRSRYEDSVFKIIGGDPSMLDPDLEVQKAKGDEKVLFERVFGKKFYYGDREKMPEEAKKYWENAKLQYNAHVYKQAGLKKKELTAKYKMLMGRFDQDASQFTKTQEKIKEEGETLRKERAKQYDKIVKNEQNYLLGKQKIEVTGADDKPVDILATAPEPTPWRYGDKIPAPALRKFNRERQKNGFPILEEKTAEDGTFDYIEASTGRSMGGQPRGEQPRGSITRGGRTVGTQQPKPEQPEKKSGAWTVDQALREAEIIHNDLANGKTTQEEVLKTMTSIIKSMPREQALEMKSKMKLIGTKGAPTEQPTEKPAEKKMKPLVPEPGSWMAKSVDLGQLLGKVTKGAVETVKKAPAAVKTVENSLSSFYGVLYDVNQALAAGVESVGVAIGESHAKKYLSNKQLQTAWANLQSNLVKMGITDSIDQKRIITEAWKSEDNPLADKIDVEELISSLTKE